MKKYTQSLSMPTRNQQLGLRGREILRTGLRVLGYVIGIPAAAFICWLLIVLVFSI